MNTETKQKALRIAAVHATTRLERNALRWLNSYGEGYDTGARGSYSDLEYGGCISGLVGHLIYSADCRTFLKRHRAEINEMLAELIADTGLNGPAELLTGWDASDPLGMDVNADRLAWFGFETAARKVAERAGIAE